MTEKALAAAEVEVVTKATRRRFPVEYKCKILREAGGRKTPAAVGALLRREGLYSSHLNDVASGTGPRGVGGNIQETRPDPAGA